MSGIRQSSDIESIEEFRRRVPDEETARRLLETMVWQNGRFCPRCGCIETRSIRGPRPGLYECRACRRQFTATTRTPLHGTKLSIRCWLEAIYLTLMSSKGISSVVLARQIGIDQASAWKIAHAIRLLMRPPSDVLLTGTVEIDTVAIAGDPKKRNIRRYGPVGKHIYNPPGRRSAAPVTLVAIEKPEASLTGSTRSGRVRVALIDKLISRTDWTDPFQHGGFEYGASFR
jgi:transposase-like protein